RVAGRDWSRHWPGRGPHRGPAAPGRSGGPHARRRGGDRLRGHRLAHGHPTGLRPDAGPGIDPQTGAAMTEDEVHTAVRAMLAVMDRLAVRTRSAADDLLVQILKSNEAKLTAAVAELVKDPVQPASPERVAAALAAVGIRC